MGSAAILLAGLTAARRSDLERALWGLGYDVSTVGLAEASAWAESNRPDAIVTPQPGALIGAAPVVTGPEDAVATLRARFPPVAVVRLSDGFVDLDAAVVQRSGAAVRLTRAETTLLRFLIAQAPREVPADELLRKVWGYRSGVRTRTVSTTVYRLRRKIVHGGGRTGRGAAGAAGPAA